MKKKKKHHLHSRWFGGQEGSSKAKGRMLWLGLGKGATCFRGEVDGCRLLTGSGWSIQTQPMHIFLPQRHTILTRS